MLSVGLILTIDFCALTTSYPGLALKYRVPRFRDNEMRLQSATNGPSLKDFYDNHPWVQSYTTETTVGSLRVTGHTPYLSGAPDNTYEFTVSIGLPPR